MLKEWYWGVIMLALVAVAFAPSFLKALCPQCKKRALRSVDLPDGASDSFAASGIEPFTTFYLCDHCAGKFKRVGSGPLEEASQTRFAPYFQKN